jgi:hypothetical protein
MSELWRIIYTTVLYQPPLQPAVILTLVLAECTPTFTSSLHVLVEYNVVCHSILLYIESDLHLYPYTNSVIIQELAERTRGRERERQRAAMYSASFTAHYNKPHTQMVVGGTVKLIIKIQQI